MGARIGLGVTAAAAIALLTAGDVRANVSVYALGVASCVKGGATGEVAYPWKGFYNNSTTAELSADCSLPFTYNSASGGGHDTHLRSIYVTVDDRNTGLNIACQMNVMSLGGDVVESGGIVTATALGEQSLSWLTNVDYGIPYISCSIPRKSGPSISGVQGIQIDYMNF